MAEEADKPKVTIQQVADEVAVYPLAAYEFLYSGLQLAVRLVHGPDPQKDQMTHVSGQELCHGLRQLALQRWGLMARLVLARWNITCTFDFGRMVWALIDAGLMSRTDTDSIEDFRAVYDMSVLEEDYRFGGGEVEAAKAE